MGNLIEFEKRRYLIDIYNDLSPKQVWLKPPQIGATVCQTLKSFYVAKKMRRQIIYTLPTQGDVQDMVGGSINRIIAQNKILMSWVKDHDTVEQKTVGDSIIFYRGTFTAKQAMMVPSGLNIHDEVDASDPEVITQYENRLQAQEDGGWRWYFSHPSLTGHGVDLYWQKSDKKEWFVTCPTCSSSFFMEWPRNVDKVRAAYVCHLCHEILPDAARINGEWRPTAQGEFSGYHVTQLMLYNKSAKQILESFNDPMKDKQYFYNYVLGLPYASSDDKISPETVLKNCVDSVNEQKSVVIGVDPGLPIHYVCMNKQGVFHYGTCDNWKRFDELLARWPRSIIVSDQGGDLTPQREMMERYPGRLFLCYYRKDRKSNTLIDWGENEEYGKVTVDRNRMMSLVVGQLRDIGRVRINGTADEWHAFAEHFGNLYRERLVVREQKDKDDRTLYGDEYVWKRSGPDHFAHALLYAMVGLSRGVGEMAKAVGEAGPFEGMKLGVMSSDQGIAASAFRDKLW